MVRGGENCSPGFEQDFRATLDNHNSPQLPLLKWEAPQPELNSFMDHKERAFVLVGPLTARSAERVVRFIACVYSTHVPAVSLLPRLVAKCVALWLCDEMFCLWHYCQLPQWCGEACDTTCSTSRFGAFWREKT